MNRTTTGIALGLAALSGTAQGQIQYVAGFSGTGIQFTTVHNVEWDGNARVRQFPFGESLPIVSTSDFLQPTYTSLQESYVLDTTNYPSINQIESTYEFAGETTDTRFEFSWDTETLADFADTIDTVNNTVMALRPINMDGPSGWTLRFAEDTRIKITFNAELSGMVGRDFGTTGAIDNSALFSFGGDAIANAFTAGDGIANDIGSSFMAEFDVLAGTDLDIDMWLDNDQLRDAVLVDGLRDWHQVNRGSLVVEVVPAPASLGVLAMGGLAATRRRR